MLPNVTLSGASPIMPGLELRRNRRVYRRVGGPKSNSKEPGFSKNPVFAKG